MLQRFVLILQRGKKDRNHVSASRCAMSKVMVIRCLCVAWIFSSAAVFCDGSDRNHGVGELFGPHRVSASDTAPFDFRHAKHFGNRNVASLLAPVVEN